MLNAKTMWRYRRLLWKYRGPLSRAAVTYYKVKHGLVPHRKSMVERHWGKALIAGAGVGLGYLVYRSRDVEA